VFVVASTLAPVAQASTVTNDFDIRYQTTARGAIALIGNTLVTCPAANATCAASQGGAGGNNNDYVMEAVDVDGDATTVNSSRASLALPVGSSVLHAELYWQGQSASASRNTVRFSAPGDAYVSVVASNVDADGINYGAAADVTALVTALADPNGAYTIADVQATTGSTNRHAGWALVVAYENASQPLRNLTIFDGFITINATAPTAIATTVSGFVTPASGPVTAQLGVVAGEGDLASTGDQFLVNGSNLTDAQNPSNNVFNSSVSRLGTRITAKVPDYVNQLGWDVDLMDATGLVPNSATSATLTFTTGGETYYPLALTFAVDVFEPSLEVPKTGIDVNGGGLLPGDAIEYEIELTNVGTDPATDVVLTDPVPTGTTFVPGSLAIIAGANSGAKTDAVADDQGEIAGGNVVFRLGTGANGSTGGTLGIGATTTVRFRVTVNSGTPPATVIHNQASVAYRGATLGQSYGGDSDGDSGSPGDQPVDLEVASPPDAVDDSATTPEDDPVDVDVLANDTDVDGDLDPTSVTVTSGPANGSTSVDPGTGVVSYTPDPGYNGPDSFTYQVCDDAGLCDSATVTLTVSSVADAPTVVDDSATTDEDVPVDIDVLANDSDADGDLDPTSVTVTSGPANGTISVDPLTGVVTYTPDPDYNGPDSFDYEVCDLTALCTSGTVTLTVDPVADPPAVVADTASTPEETPVDVDVLANDSDADGDLDPTSVTVTAGPTNGTVSVDPLTGVVTYTPDPDYNGSDAFTYEVCDLTALCTTGTVTLTVGSVDDPPVANDDSATVDEDDSVAVDVLGNDSDPDGDLDPTSVTVTSGPANGTVSIDPVTGAITYTPDPGFNGPDSFDYQVCDLTALCATGTVSVTVDAVDDPPVVVDDVATVDEDGAVVVDVVANDSDPDGDLDPTTVTVTSGPSHGIVTIDPATGAVTYTPDPDYNGPDAFTYEVCDDTGLCTSGTVTVTVDAVADPPTVVDDTVSVSQDGTTVIDVLGNDSDPDGDLDPTTVTVTSGPSHGTVAIDPVTGAITYTPAAGYAGPDSFTYQVCDATGLCTTGTVAVGVVAIPPTDQAAGSVASTPTQDPWSPWLLIPFGLAAILVTIGIVRRQRPR
jgi:uncharacterized repeat protein (TIGR01451 family)